VRERTKDSKITAEGSKMNNAKRDKVMEKERRNLRKKVTERNRKEKWKINKKGKERE
jgi:hypothetical protein